VHGGGAGGGRGGGYMTIFERQTERERGLRATKTKEMFKRAGAACITRCLQLPCWVRQRTCRAIEHVEECNATEGEVDGGRYDCRRASPASGSA